MNITVQNVDAINFIISGSIENSVIEAKVASLKAAHEALPEEERPVRNESYEQEAAGVVFQQFIEAGIQKAGIAVENLLGQPGLRKYEKHDSAVTIEAEIAIAPEINTDVELSDIVPEYTKPVASVDAVEAKLEEFSKQQAPYGPIAQPRALADGDVSVIDFTGYMNGIPFEGGSAEKFKLQVGSQSFIPGFEEQLIGMEYGEQRTISVTFPENYQAADLAGKETQFEVTLHEIQERQELIADDAFAQKVLKKEDATLETLKEKLSDQIMAQELSSLYENELKPKLISGLLSKFDFLLPNNIVEQEIDAKIREKLQQLPETEQKALLQDKVKFHELRDSLRPAAQDGIKIAIIIEALAKKEGIAVDDQEVYSALAYQAMMTGQNAQELVKYYQENNLMTAAKLGLTEDKLFGQMLGFDK